MYPRTQYEMTQEDLQTLMDSMKPVPMIMLQCGTPPSQQENANNAWKVLGDKMGFDHMTVQPISGKGERFFTAVPNENEEAKKERIKREKIQFKQDEIKRIQDEINALETRLTKVLEDEV